MTPVAVSTSASPAGPGLSPWCSSHSEASSFPSLCPVRIRLSSFTACWSRPADGRRGACGSGHRLGLLGSRRRGNGLGLVASSPEALLGTLLGESVARADLDPRGSGLAGGLNLGGLQFLGRFSQAPGGFEPPGRQRSGDISLAVRRPLSAGERDEAGESLPRFVPLPVYANSRLPPGQGRPGCLAYFDSTRPSGSGPAASSSCAACQAGFPG